MVVIIIIIIVIRIGSPTGSPTGVIGLIRNRVCVGVCVVHGAGDVTPFLIQITLGVKFHNQ